MPVLVGLGQTASDSSRPGGLGRPDRRGRGHHWPGPGPGHRPSNLQELEHLTSVCRQGDNLQFGSVKGRWRRTLARARVTSRSHGSLTRLSSLVVCTSSISATEWFQFRHFSERINKVGIILHRIPENCRNKSRSHRNLARKTRRKKVSPCSDVVFSVQVTFERLSVSVAVPF